MDTCIFCKIIKGEIPSTKIYEDDKTYVFLDIHPVNIGHTLVIPKEHYADIYELPDDIAAHLLKVIKRISTAVKKAVGADGINIVMNNESAAGQVVFHAHLHVIPRITQDGFPIWHGKRPYMPDEDVLTAQKIISAL